MERLKKHFKTFIDDIERHEIFTLSGSLAYTTALSLAPFMLILLSFTSMSTPALQEKIFTQLSASIGANAGQMVIDVIHNTQKDSSISGLSGLIGFVVLAISASAIFSQIRVALDKINDHENTETCSGFWAFIKDRFFAIGLVFGFAFLTIVSLIFSIAMTFIFANGEGLLWKWLSAVINIVTFTTLFAAIFKFVPSDKLGWKRCYISGFISTIFYLIGKSLIGLYIAHAALENVYGAAGSFIAFLLWVYYSALTLLVSYQFTRDIILSDRTVLNEKAPSLREPALNDYFN